MQETFLKFFLVGAHFQKPQWTYWTWKIRHGLRGRPCVAKETRELIRALSRDNVGWGAPRIHSELLKLGHQDLRILDCQIHGPPAETAVANVADILEESREATGLRRLLHRSDGSIPGPVPG